jgi:hypothetical protein
MADYILIPDDIFELDRFLLADDEAKDTIIVFWLRLYTMCEKRTKDGYPFISVRGVELNDNVLRILTDKMYSEAFISNTMRKLESAGAVIREPGRIIVVPPWVNKRDRSQIAYKKWRMAVYERDGFKCCECGSKKNLNAHHIIHWARLEKGDPLKFDINNGVTLCKKCHLKAHGGCWHNGSTKNVLKTNH